MKVTSPENLGLILRAVRKKKHLSQAEAGQSVGIDQPTLSKIERGESNFRIDTLFRLLAALDMEMTVKQCDQNADLNQGDDW